MLTTHNFMLRCPAMIRIPLQRVYCKPKTRFAWRLIDFGFEPFGCFATAAILLRLAAGSRNSIRKSNSQQHRMVSPAKMGGQCSDQFRRSGVTAASASCSGNPLQDVRNTDRRGPLNRDDTHHRQSKDHRNGCPWSKRGTGQPLFANDFLKPWVTWI